MAGPDLSTVFTFFNPPLKPLIESNNAPRAAGGRAPAEGPPAGAGGADGAYTQNKNIVRIIPITVT